MNEQSKAPIQLISDQELLALCDSKYLKVFDEAPWDEYLLRQQHIEYLKTAMGDQLDRMLSTHHIANYYLGKLDWNDLVGILGVTFRSHIEETKLIKPTRKRYISDFEIKINKKEIEIERVPTKPFGQSLSEIEKSSDFDYRKLSRVFSELPDEYLNEAIYKLIRKSVSKIPDFNNINKIKLSVHHTRIVCGPEENVSNSPEGIHQDGMDYIVSAFVVERNNITGGESIIYKSDKSTPILKATLQPGMGLFQPDFGSGLWHLVTPVKVKDNFESGWRSSIGLDFTVLE